MKSNILLKTIALSLSLALFIPLAGVAKAQDVPLSQSDVQRNEEKVTKAFLVTEDGLKEISLQEYNQLVVGSHRVQQATPISDNFNTLGDNPFLNIVTKVEFKQNALNREVLQTSMKKDISDWIKNTGYTVTLEQEVTSQTTQSFTVSGGLSLTQLYFKSLEGTFGVGWEDSKSWSYTSKVSVPPRTQAKLQFTPLYDVAIGDFLGYNRYGTKIKEDKSITVKSPTLLPGNKAKGVVTVVESKL